MHHSSPTTHPTITTEQMQHDYIVRFDEPKERGIPLMFIDSILPGHQRTNYAVIGRIPKPEFAPATVPIRCSRSAAGRTSNGPAFPATPMITMLKCS